MSNYTDELILTQNLIDEFLANMTDTGCSSNTLISYRSNLRRIFKYLPENKAINASSLDILWQKMAASGFETTTINTSKSVLNSLVSYVGRRDLQVLRQQAEASSVSPELSREEYYKLLQTAKNEYDERAYLLVKIFACMDISTSALDKITVEAVDGPGLTNEAGGNIPAGLVIPECLRDEIKSYAIKKGIKAGSIFLNGKGKPLSSTSVGRAIARLSLNSGVQREKCNVRCLQRLYQITREDIDAQISALGKQMYDNLMKQEQQMFGWSVMR